MYCSFCKLYQPDSTSVFVKGCVNLRLDPIKIHEKSPEHIKCVERHVAENQPPSSSEASKCLMKLNKAQYGQLSIKMRTAHFVAKHHKSFLDYKNICQLDKMKGLDVGTSYTTDKGGALLMTSVASVSRGEITDILKRAPFFSFTCDGSSDFTGDDMESVYVRTCSNGVIRDQFLAIGCPASSTSLDIHSHITETFDHLGLDDVYRNRLVGFCSDGASNMQGKSTHLYIKPF